MHLKCLITLFVCMYVMISLVYAAVASLNKYYSKSWMLKVQLIVHLVHHYLYVPFNLLNFLILWSSRVLGMLSLKWSRYSLPCMEPRGSLLCSQELTSHHLSQMYSVHTFTSYFFKIHFNGLFTAGNLNFSFLKLLLTSTCFFFPL